MAETEVRVVLADAVVVGPEDRLIIHLKEGAVPDDVEALMNDMNQIFVGMGIGDRVCTLVTRGDDVEFVKVAKE